MNRHTTKGWGSGPGLCRHGTGQDWPSLFVRNRFAAGVDYGGFPMTGIPDAPEHLSVRMREYWRTIVEEYHLGTHQVELLRRLCEAADRADEARVLLDADGLTVADRYGQVKPHPAVTIERDARVAVARLTRELALEPAAEDPRPPRTGAVNGVRR